jgi:ABC-type branched-subunit amino acid transport system permease subunit
MDAFICEIATVGASAHATHLLHLGLAGIVSLGGGIFLGLGVVASRRARRDRLRALSPRRRPEG